MRFPCPLPQYQGVDLVKVNSEIDYPDQTLLSQGPGTSSLVRYDKKNPSTIKAILKGANFKNETEEPKVRSEADRCVPIINSQPFNQKIIDYKVGNSVFQGVYEYIEGEDLYDYMDRRKQEGSPLTVPEAADIVMQVAEMMAKMHELKVLHRNIKLSNILRRTTDGQLFIGDYSFANMMLAKVYFGTKFHPKLGMHNINLETDQPLDSIIGYNRDSYSTLLCFCQLLGKTIPMNPTLGQDKDSFMDLSGLQPQVPIDVIKKIKEMTLNTGNSNRPTMKEIASVMRNISGKKSMVPQVNVQVDKEVQIKALLDISFKDVDMVHPCSNLDDKAFCNYLMALQNKINHPFEKIRLHFGGNQLTVLSSQGLSQAFKDINTSKLKSLSIHLSNNKLTSIDSFIEVLRYLQLTGLTKLQLGFNNCELKITDIRDICEVVNKQCNSSNMRRLQMDFRNNCINDSQIGQTYQNIKTNFKQKISSKQTNKQSPQFFVKI